MNAIQIFLIGILFGSCQMIVPINNIRTAPAVVPMDSSFAHVYQVLDGTWKGQFKIFEDLDRRPIDSITLQNVKLGDLEKPSLKLINVIEVEQLYSSKSPYFQKVWIKDTYKDGEGKVKTVKSEGVNKVQDGRMWCVVVKPDETVIHAGRTEGEKTIIWQRHEKNPQKVEYFKETVDTSLYEIIGYGYYEGDELNLSPKYWFYGKYLRQ